MTDGSSVLIGMTFIRYIRLPVKAVSLACLVLLAVAGSAPAATEYPVEYVIHISVDGLRPDALGLLGPSGAPNFFRMRVEGAITDNARADYDMTVTLPNHICMATGRGVLGPDGHGVDFNFDDGGTVADAHGSYVASVFDVVHDHGLSTALYTTKSKFDLIDRSWNELNGAPDTFEDDDGTDKIDRYVYQTESIYLTDSLLAVLPGGEYRYTFFHFGDPDGAGHSYGWNSLEYLDTVEKVDRQIGRIFDFLDSDPEFQGRTAVILTSDHGGYGFDHYDAAIPENYTVPVFVWGPGVPAGADLYMLNPASRLDPGDTRPDYLSVRQPIRNAGTGNLALDILGLPPIPGSTINDDHDLIVFAEEGDLPDVEITSPDSAAIFSILDTVRIEADVSVISGAVDKVEFFANWAKIGEDLSQPYSFDWIVISAGEYVVTARAVMNNGTGATDGVDIEVTSTQTGADDDPLPKAPVAVCPNPFSRSTRIDYSVDSSQRVTLSVYDIRGRKVGSRSYGLKGTGRHSAYFDGSGLEPGVYFYRMHLGARIATGKFMIIR